MRKGHPQICLFQPEIPQNTGNIGRLAAATGCRLHLIRPLGFKTDDKNLRRSGLDYWPFLDLEVHDDMDFVLEKFLPRVAFLSTRGEKRYTDIPPTTELLVFGRETCGFTDEIYDIFRASLYRIPIFNKDVRSLNLANAVSIVVYDQIVRRRF